jgi:hypothetical protein
MSTDAPLAEVVPLRCGAHLTLETTENTEKREESTEESAAGVT